MATSVLCCASIAMPCPYCLTSCTKTAFQGFLISHAWRLDNSQIVMTASADQLLIILAWQSDNKQLT